MKVNGLTPGQGNPADKLGAAKRPQAAPGKSFADALKKAAQGASEAPSTPAPAAHPGAAAATPSEAAKYPAAESSAETHLATIKHRMQTGYYDSKKVEDAISDKLSGYFDEIA
jgi:hypothetical protein